MPTQLYTFGANQELVDFLTAKGARFIVVGGLAVHYHFPQRQVDDLDLLVEPSISTAEKVIAALSSCPLINYSITVEQIVQSKKVQIPAKVYFYADIITPGEDINFDEQWHEAHDAKLGNTSVKVASVKTLLKLLSQSSEPKHTQDIALLSSAAHS